MQQFSKQKGWRYTANVRRGGATDKDVARSFWLYYSGKESLKSCSIASLPASLR